MREDIRVFECLSRITRIINMNCGARLRMDDTEGAVVLFAGQGRTEPGGDLDPGVRHDDCSSSRDRGV